jgi:hypothetical protein
MMKNMLKVMGVVLGFFSSPIFSQNAPAKKKINVTNAIKATLLSVGAAGGLFYYYQTIISPHVIELIRKKGLAHAIQFNKAFISQHPHVALAFATPVLKAAFCAWLASDYLKKIWEEQEEVIAAEQIGFVGNCHD